MIAALEKGITELPEGWKWVRLGDVAQFKNGINFTSNQKGQGILTVDVLNMYSESIYLSLDELYRVDIAPKNDYLLLPNDVLFVRSSVKEEGVGWATLFPTHSEAITFCGFLIRARLIASVICAPFLVYYLRYPPIRGLLISKAGRGTITNISQDKLQSLRIPLPPLAEQQRIVAILNEQLTAVEKARAATAEQLKAAKALPAAYLREVFESEEAQQWEKKRLDEVANIGAGIALGRPLRGETRKVSYLRVANVKDGHLDLSDVYKTDATEAEISKCLLKYGDILLTEGGDPDKLGRGTFWEEKIPDCIHQNHIFRVRFDLDKFCPKFVAFQIGSSYGKEYFLSHAKQTTGIATINRTVLSGFPLMVPPINEQKSISAVLTAQRKEIEKVRQSLQDQLGTINKLPAAILRCAFNGEL